MSGFPLLLNTAKMPSETNRTLEKRRFRKTTDPAHGRGHGGHRGARSLTLMGLLQRPVQLLVPGGRGRPRGGRPKGR